MHILPPLFASWQTPHLASLAAAAGDKKAVALCTVRSLRSTELLRLTLIAAVAISRPAPVSRSMGWENALPWEALQWGYRIGWPRMPSAWTMPELRGWERDLALTLRPGVCKPMPSSAAPRRSTRSAATSPAVQRASLFTRTILSLLSVLGQLMFYAWVTD